MDEFHKPILSLADHIQDERVHGFHLWTARNSVPEDGAQSLLSRLLDRNGFPDLMDLADGFNTDKNRHTGNRHFYSRVYEGLLSSERLSTRRLMEIGLCRGLAEGNQSETPSVALWQSYFPFVEVIGVDLTDFSRLNNSTFRTFVCDQSKLEDLRTVASQIEPGSLDVIIDDGSHASHDEQLTLKAFFPLVRSGGWYIIEDLDWQPPGEDPAVISLTKALLRDIRDFGAPKCVDPFGIGGLSGGFSEIHFFDSHYELTRAGLMGGLAAIRKR